MFLYYGVFLFYAYKTPFDIHLIEALIKIIAYGVDHIVYISCKPTSLVRDLEGFLENGYRVDKAVAVDQFPWTANVETVVLLSKGAKGPVDLCSTRTEVERS